MADKETDQRKKATVAVAAATSGTTTRGAGVTGSVATATVTLVKATATPSPAIVQANRIAAVTPPATAGSFDRTVATSLGK